MVVCDGVMVAALCVELKSCEDAREFAYTAKLATLIKNVAVTTVNNVCRDDESIAIMELLVWARCTKANTLQR